MAGLPSPRDRVFCARSLRLDQVEWVGFDMDYTLAIYRQEAMDRISVDATVRRLIERGYPQLLRGVAYPHDFAIRGLLVDTRLGNVLKMDRYRYVKRGYHGLTELTREQRREHYEARRLRPGTSRYHWVDTLYALSEVTVYAAAIDALEHAGYAFDPQQLFTDVRECIDLAHGSGEIFEAMAPDLNVFLDRDEKLGLTLHRLRSSGKRLFLLTNSHARSTEAIMAHLLDERVAQYPSWRQYFDVIVTAAGKPGFFSGKAPFVHTEHGEEVSEFRRGAIYQGGNIDDFENALGVKGDQLLYVGDHIYGDVLRANVGSGWRTAMIVQELDAELAASAEHRDHIARIDELDEALRAGQDEIRLHRAALESQRGDGGQLSLEWPIVEDPAEPRSRKAMIDRLLRVNREIEIERDELEEKVERAFHPYWGSIFKAGTELSSLGWQVEQYAWLYTDRVSNLSGYSPFHYFRSPPRSDAARTVIGLRIGALVCGVALVGTGCTKVGESDVALAARSDESVPATTTTEAPANFDNRPGLPQPTVATSSTSTALSPSSSQTAVGELDLEQRLAVVFDLARPFDEKAPYIENAEAVRELHDAYVQLTADAAEVTITHTEPVIQGERAGFQVTASVDGEIRLGPVDGEARISANGWIVTTASVCASLSLDC